jgi:hypothetical protein
MPMNWFLIKNGKKTREDRALRKEGAQNRNDKLQEQIQFD